MSIIQKFFNKINKPENIFYWKCATCGTLYEIEYLDGNQNNVKFQYKDRYGKQDVKYLGSNWHDRWTFGIKDPCQACLQDAENAANEKLASLASQKGKVFMEKKIDSITMGKIIEIIGIAEDERKLKGNNQ